MKNAITLRQVSKTYASGKKALDNINLTIEKGDFFGLLGPNGAGKTSLVKIALGLIKPTTGSVEKRKHLRIGYMPQRLHIDHSMPVSVERFLKLAVSAGNNEISTEINNVLGEVGADSLRHNQLYSLSGGELQRVLLARALIQKPELLVLDEPAQGVDVNGQAELYRLISDIRNRHQCGILLVSHDLHLVMAATDHVVCLNTHVCCSGRPDSVTRNPEYLALFGHRVAETHGLYTHDHDHSHDISGEASEDTGEKTEHLHG